MPYVSYFLLSKLARPSVMTIQHIFYAVTVVSIQAIVPNGVDIAAGRPLDFVRKSSNAARMGEWRAATTYQSKAESSMEHCWKDSQGA
jgi:hypothetical protein